jgi:hypothetical protein
MHQVTDKWLHLLGEYEFPDGLAGGDESGVVPRSGALMSDAVMVRDECSVAASEPLM